MAVHVRRYLPRDSFDRSCITPASPLLLVDFLGYNIDVFESRWRVASFDSQFVNKTCQQIRGRGRSPLPCGRFTLLPEPEPVESEPSTQHAVTQGV